MWGTGGNLIQVLTHDSNSGETAEKDVAVQSVFKEPLRPPEAEEAEVRVGRTFLSARIASPIA